MTAKFGPAGNSDAFYEAGNKATLQIPGYLESLGLTAYEYQCGRGVTVGEETARKLGAKAAEHGITLSLHAPYYISLSSAGAREAARPASATCWPRRGRWTGWAAAV